jgi:hypothetical protein
MEHMKITVDYGRKPGLIPPPIQVVYRKSTSDEIAETIILEDTHWTAFYKFSYERRGEMLYNLTEVHATQRGKQNAQTL